MVLADDYIPGNAEIANPLIISIGRSLRSRAGLVCLA